MAAALDRSYDGIIIGAGPSRPRPRHLHGAARGSKILLVERRLMYGGGLATVEATPPGFYHNYHSINHFHITRRRGSATSSCRARRRREALTSSASRKEALRSSSDATRSDLGVRPRFSKKDADKFREWNPKAEAMTQVLLPERFAEPLRRRSARRCWRGRARPGLRGITNASRSSSYRRVRARTGKASLHFKLSLFGTWPSNAARPSPQGSVIRQSISRAATNSARAAASTSRAG